MLKTVLAGLAIAALLATPALALESTGAGANEPAAQITGSGAKHYLGVAMALALGVAAFGGAFGQGRAVSAAVEAVARQPEAGGRIQTMMIIGLALIETLVIYVLLMWFIWNGKLDT